MPTTNYLGFDPGGQIGVALFTVENGQCHCATDCVDSVERALACATSLLNSRTPNAAGLDALLYWETTKSGWRQADHWLREKYPTVRNSILSSNSMAGSMAVQGMSLAMLLRQRWRQIELIETHPKVLYYALAKRKYKWPLGMRAWLLNEMNCVSIDIANDHCFDAALSAWAAFKGHTRCWNRDLRALSDAPIEPSGPCAFWWPE